VLIAVIVVVVVVYVTCCLSFSNSINSLLRKRKHGDGKNNEVDMPDLTSIVASNYSNVPPGSVFDGAEQRGTRKKDEWEIDFTELKLIKPIGEGDFGKCSFVVGITGLACNAPRNCILCKMARE
jgi:hypothetical protein